LSATRFISAAAGKFFTAVVAMTALAGAASIGAATAAHAAPATVRGAATPAQHSAPSQVLPAAVGPGASIGTAWPPLPGGTTDRQSLTQGEDWYILYKKHDSAIASIVVTNLASNSGLACSGFYVTLYGVDGTGDAINSYGLNSTDSAKFTVPGAEAGDTEGRYYLEITPSCGNGLSDGQAYTITAGPAAEWASPARVPFAKPLAPGASIGSAWPPLQGDRVYASSLNIGEHWYILYKKDDSATASVRIANTTVAGSIGCDSVYATIYGVDSTGDAIGSYGLGDNQAVTATLPGSESGDAQGRYYLEITPSCGNGLSDGQAYTIEPEPAAEWGHPARVPFGKATPAASLGGAWPPLRGGLVYPGALTSAENWYAIDKKSDSTVASIRVAATTVAGSLSCASLYATLYGAGGVGDAIGSYGLGDNQAVTIGIPGSETGDATGRYYLEITPSCGNGLSDGQPYTVELEPAAQWGDDAVALPFGTAERTAKGPLAGGVNYTASVLKKGAQEWAYFVTKGAATVKVQDTAASSAGCRLVIAVGSSKASLTSGQLAALRVAPAGRYYLELTPAAGCTPKSALGALLELTGSVG
jgi:hypothetical protein